MAHAAHEDALLERIARLRRAERDLPPNRDLVAVRAALEGDLGEVVSRRMAARALGVSHTALRRWVARGDVPVVADPAGRVGVPLGALLDLRAAIEDERARGRRGRHALEAAILADHARANRLDPRTLIAESPAADDLSGHRRAELRALAYHRALARRLDRRMADDALRQVWKWRERDAIDPHYADRWEEILAMPIADIKRAIGQDDESSAALRQTSPFAGMLGEAERRRIIEEVA